MTGRHGRGRARPAERTGQRRRGQVNAAEDCRAELPGEAARRNCQAGPQVVDLSGCRAAGKSGRGPRKGDHRTVKGLRQAVEGLHQVGRTLVLLQGGRPADDLPSFAAAAVVVAAVGGGGGEEGVGEGGAGEGVWRDALPGPGGQEGTGVTTWPAHPEDLLLVLAPAGGSPLSGGISCLVLSCYSQSIEKTNRIIHQAQLGIIR